VRLASGFLAAAVAIFVQSASAKPDPEQPSPQRAYCNLMRSCKIPDKTLTCTEATSAPVNGVELDQTYCSWVRGFTRRGIHPTTPDAMEMFRYMGTKYHVMYVVADTVPIPLAALDHLMANIPVAAKLINSYRDTKYDAEYPKVGDSSYFKGSNGKNLSGVARQLWIRDDHRERVYWGQGKVSVLKWNLVGNVVIEFRAWPASPGSPLTCYSLRFTMFPANALVNSIMNMGMFKSVALGKIQEILDDVMQASQAYAQGKPPLKSVAYTPEEQKVLAEFERFFKAANPSSPVPSPSSVPPDTQVHSALPAKAPAESLKTSPTKDSTK